MRGVWGYYVGKNLGEKRRKVEKEEDAEEGTKEREKKEGSERERESSAEYGVCFEGDCAFHWYCKSP